MMKWIILTGFLICLARSGAGGALKCTSGVEDPLCRIDKEDSNKTSLVEGNECAPGTHWKSKCNDCACSPEGHPSCTEKACPGFELELEKECAPESRWKKECNSCWCTPDGLALCTKIGCNGIPANQHFNDESSQGKPDVKASLSRKTRGLPQANTQSTPKACEPGKVFRMDCNQCLCDNEGQDFSCTRIDCTALNNINNGGTRTKRDNQFDATDSSFRCNPGEQYKRGCEDCTCSADGKSIFCSVRLCDKDLAHIID